MLQRLDENVQVGESILAEQMLQNAGINEDQKLMVRTILGGKMTVEGVGDELLNQHPRIHEKERNNKGRFHPPFRGKGQWHRGKPMYSNFAEDDNSEWT